MFGINRDIFVEKIRKRAYICTIDVEVEDNEKEIREFIRDFSKETLHKGNNTGSNVATSRSKRTTKDDGRIDKNSEREQKRNELQQRNEKINSNNDVGDKDGRNGNKESNNARTNKRLQKIERERKGTEKNLQKI